jgi:hypothetical protein
MDAPERVRFEYRLVGETHVLASRDIVGLVHVGHHELAEVSGAALGALSLHVAHAYGAEARYEWDGLTAIRKCEA